MNTVLIVDDELPARELLKLSIKSIEKEFTIIGEARNGEDAYSKYKKLSPDIVITDIQMPLVDGIELIKRIKQDNIKQKIVILSCHESFEYAKLAIKLGVSDYLIKDSYTDNELISLLKSISTEKEEDNNIIEGKEDISIYFNKFLNNDEEAIGIIEENFAEKKKNYFITVCDIGNENNIEYEEIDNTISYKISKNRVVSLHKIEENSSRLLTLNNWYSEISTFKKSMDKYNKKIITIGVSKLFNKFDDIEGYYKQAVQALEFIVFYGKGKIIYFENIEKRNDIRFIDQFKENFKMLKTAFDHRNNEKVVSIIRDIYEKNISGMMLYNYLYYVNSLLFGYLTYVITTFNMEFEDICEKDEVSISKINELNSFEEMGKWMEDKFTLVLKQIEEDEKYSRIVKQALSYIKENYNYDFSIEEVAENIGIHKAYLSRVFKAEVGKTISLYLTELRIARAVELFKNKEVKNSEIPYSIGYNSAQNFHHAFKQIMGITPKEYQIKNKL